MAAAVAPPAGGDGDRTDQLAAVGVSGGGSHGLALACVVRDLVARAVVVNPGPPSDDWSLRLLAGSDPAPMIRLARTRPRLFRTVAGVLQSRHPLMLRLQRRQLDPLDLAVLEGPHAAQFERSAQEGRSQPGAWVDEAAMLWGGPWGLDLSGAGSTSPLQVPVDVFAGEHDPFRPFAEHLARSHHLARPGEHPGEGELSGELSGGLDRRGAQVTVHDFPGGHLSGFTDEVMLEVLRAAVQP